MKSVYACAVGCRSSQNPVKFSVAIIGTDLKPSFETESTIETRALELARERWPESRGFYEHTAVVHLIPLEEMGFIHQSEINNHASLHQTNPYDIQGDAIRK